MAAAGRPPAGAEARNKARNKTRGRLSEESKKEPKKEDRKAPRPRAAFSPRQDAAAQRTAKQKNVSLCGSYIVLVDVGVAERNGVTVDGPILDVGECLLLA